MSERLSLHRDGPVARLRMTRPQVHNAFDAGLIAELTAAGCQVVRVAVPSQDDADALARDRHRAGE